jgi:hypothetical protein
LIALPFFGIAQVITYFGRTAHHAESIDNSLKVSLYHMQKTITSISEQMATLPKTGASSTPLFSKEQVLNCPRCTAEIPAKSLIRGVNVCPECEQDIYDRMTRRKDMPVSCRQILLTANQTTTAAPCPSPA